MTAKTIFKSSLVAMLIGAAAVSPSAPAFAAEAAAVQLVQPGDADLTCEALASQINALASNDAQPKKKKRGFGLGSLTKVLSVASPMLGGMGGSGMGGMIANQAISVAQTSAMESQMQDTMDGAMAAANPMANQSIEQQRKNRLMGFYESKGC